MKAGAAGWCLLPLILLGCSDPSKLEIRRVIASPDHLLIAVYSYWKAGPMMSDDTRVQVFLRDDDDKLVQRCWVYRGNYDKIIDLHWIDDGNLRLIYQSTGTPTIAAKCRFELQGSSGEISISARRIPS